MHHTVTCLGYCKLKGSIILLPINGHIGRRPAQARIYTAYWQFSFALWPVLHRCTVLQEHGSQLFRSGDQGQPRYAPFSLYQLLSSFGVLWYKFFSGQYERNSPSPTGVPLSLLASVHSGGLCWFDRSFRLASEWMIHKHVCNFFTYMPFKEPTFKDSHSTRVSVAHSAIDQIVLNFTLPSGIRGIRSNIIRWQCSPLITSQAWKRLMQLLWFPVLHWPTLQQGLLNTKMSSQVFSVRSPPIKAATTFYLSKYHSLIDSCTFITDVYTSGAIQWVLASIMILNRVEAYL